MEERIRDDGFEVTFVVSTPREQAWTWLTEARPAVEGLAEMRDGQRWIPAVEAPGDELEVQHGSMLRVRKAVQPCKGTEIVIVLEDDETGTRITFVQTGFGEGFAAQRPWLDAGWHAIKHDLVVFFNRGVSLGRHVTGRWSSIGCDVTEADEGLVVESIRPGGFADQAGLQRGDLILRLAGAPVVSVRELSVLARALQPGAEAKVRFLRGTEARSGSGLL
ncbi:MAG TPA: PDZ domain-containing protein [Actinomycetota bacterium]|jgi:hypothetical protein|nr:PDZ domain-containing protein [Actinomycetota bacterium]